MQEVAQRLKSLRESVGLSQAKLAALMGATQASVNRYENGQSSPPLKILRWYADFFDVSLDYIFARTEQPEGKLYEMCIRDRLTGEDKTWQFCLNFRQHYQFLLCDFSDTARYSVLDINQSVAL